MLTSGKKQLLQKKREGLDLTIRMHKLIFWRRVTQTLKDMHANNKDIVNNHTNNIISKQGYKEKHTGTRGSQPNPKGQGEAQLVSDREPAPEVVRVVFPMLLSRPGNNSSPTGNLAWISKSYCEVR